MDKHCQVVNLLPAGSRNGYGVGRDVECSADLQERIAVSSQIGHIYLTIEGGPGVAKVALAAFERGAFVLPMASTGGASAGMFGFPAAALERPSYASQEQWDCLTQPGVEVDSAALAIVQLVRMLISGGGARCWEA